MFYKIGCLKNVTNFTGKHLDRSLSLCLSLSLFLSEDCTLETCNFIQKNILTQVFPVNFVETYFVEHLLTPRSRACRKFDFFFGYNVVLGFFVFFLGYNDYNDLDLLGIQYF